MIVGTERPGEEGGPPTMKLVPLGGEWDTQGKQAGLHTTAKNPMSLALDHDKLVVSRAHTIAIHLLTNSMGVPMGQSSSLALLVPLVPTSLLRRHGGRPQRHSVPTT